MRPDGETPEQPIPISPPDGPADLPPLTPRSRELWETLLREGGRLGDLYEGALRVLADASNPVRSEMAAYALRELIEALERTAVRSDSKGPKLGDLVERLRNDWEKVGRSAEGDALIDPGEAILAVDRFLADADRGEKRRRNRAQTTIRELDPARREGPPAVSELRVGRLLEFLDEFNAVVHGIEATPVTELEAKLRRFERFLLDWFRPQTFADFDAIDALLKDGPPQ